MDDRQHAEVVIVGAGPAGLGAAIGLRARGVERVVVVERESEVGGAARHCGHPTFGLREYGRLLTGPAYIERLRRRAERSGVGVRTDHSVVALGPGGRLSLATPAGSVEMLGRRVVLATGARETPRSVRLVSGERPLGVLNTGALQSYVYLKGLIPFRRPVVVGTELVGLSALWTCISHGVRPAAVIEARSRATAPWPLGLFPRLLGVPVHYDTEISAISGGPRVRSVEVMGRNGVRRSIDCDGALFTGGFIPETSLLRAADLDIDPGGGGAAVDQYGRCSDPAYFAVGNLLRGVETAGWCYREGLGLAQVVALDLASELPQAMRCLPIRCGAGVRLTSPQRLAPPFVSVPPPIQVRASDSIRGRLTVRGDGEVLWSRAVRLRPERRILIPTSWAPAAETCSALSIGVE